MITPLVPKVNAKVIGSVAVLLCSIGQAVATEVITAARQQELRHLLSHDCGSCHGLTLRGGLGPALTPETLAGKSRQAMVTTILQGRTGTPMPPWSPLLSREEAEWLVEVMYRGLKRVE
jgi:cytochrome c55X